MRVNAKLSPNTAPSGVINFRLTVLHRCVRNFIFPKDPVLVIKYVMQVKNPKPTIYVFPEWT